MCNIAGYVGTRQAAPILLEMMLREEGFCAGYYTGIATLDSGTIRYEKLVGHTKMLIDEKNALSLPGTVGICHGRSRGCGGESFAHPFVSEKDGEVVSAYIANGNNAPFSDTEKDASITLDIIRQGFTLSSKTDEPITKANYPHLPDGTVVHVSDVMCQLITKKINEGLSIPKAMERSFIEMPSKLVGLYLHKDNPDTIVWAKTNMPIFIAYADHGVYVASTPTAFPNDAGDPIPMLPYTYGSVSKDGFTVFQFSEKKGRIAPLDARVRAASYKLINEMLAESPKVFSELSKAVTPLFEDADIFQAETAIYEVLYSLQKQNKIKIEPIFAPGPYGVDVPKNIISLI